MALEVENPIPKEFKEEEKGEEKEEMPDYFSMTEEELKKHLPEDWKAQSSGMFFVSFLRPCFVR